MEAENITYLSTLEEQSRKSQQASFSVCNA